MRGPRRTPGAGIRPETDRTDDDGPTRQWAIVVKKRREPVPKRGFPPAANRRIIPPADSPVPPPFPSTLRGPEPPEASAPPALPALRLE